MILAATLAIAIAASINGESNLVGLWESKETSQGGIGHAFQFRPDGTFVDAAVVMVEIPYRVTGDRLVLGEEPPAGKPDTRQTSSIRFEGDALLQTGPDGSVLRRERLPGSAKTSGVLGDWRYCHYAGAIAYDRFTDSGKLLLRLPMRSSTGRYLVAGDALTLSKPSQPDAQLKAEVRDGKLVVSGSTGKRAEYRHEPSGAWYDVAHVEKCTPAYPVAPPPTPSPNRAVDSVLPHARSHPPIEHFVGLWRNVDPNTRGWTRLEIKAKKDALRVRIFGKCHPSDCDLGTATAQYKGSPIVLSMDLGFVKSRFTLSLEDETLRMTTADHFMDDSGRPDAVYDSRFRK